MGCILGRMEDSRLVIYLLLRRPPLASCVMRNHFHRVLSPKADGDLSRFMRWLTLTHTRVPDTLSGPLGNGLTTVAKLAKLVGKEASPWKR